MRFLFNSEFEWRKPPAGFIKLNCDAAWKEFVGGGVGIIARDSERNIVAIRAIRKAGVHSSNICEGLGLLEGLRLAESLKADRVIFELDCVDVVKWLNIRPDTHVAYEDWFKESLQILHRHMEWKIFLIRREANVIADHLAKRVINQNWCWTRLDCCPRLSCFSS
ncbi:hypothetical protein QQ045_026100 [Rhodiola kirilowii]